MLDFMLVIHRYKIANNDMDQDTLDQCLSTSDAITSIIETLAQTGALTYIQDTSSCMTSSMVTLLVKVCYLAVMAATDPQIMQTSRAGQKQIIVEQLQRLLLANSLASASADVATAYVARFIKRVLSSMVYQSRAATPVPLGHRAAGSPVIAPAIGPADTGFENMVSFDSQIGC